MMDNLRGPSCQSSVLQGNHLEPGPLSDVFHFRIKCIDDSRVISIPNICSFQDWLVSLNIMFLIVPPLEMNSSTY